MVFIKIIIVKIFIFIKFIIKINNHFIQSLEKLKTNKFQSTYFKSVNFGKLIDLKYCQ
jgi:hypothetical protein